jgi:IclR-like helix-turn-helix domain-containing protein
MIGLGREESIRVVARVASDCLPPTRLAVLHQLAEASETIDTTTVAEAIGLPTTTARNALEELTPRRIVRRNIQGQGKADLWSLTGLGRAGLALLSPELRAGSRLPHLGVIHDEDGVSSEFSGWVSGHPEKSEEGSS